jgi:hypothetical protein
VPPERVCILRAVDEGQPIAYQMLDEGVAVIASDGTQVGTVGAVLDAPEKDVFHGLLVNTPHHGIRFLEAAVIASIHASLGEHHHWPQRLGSRALSSDARA